MRSDGKSSDQPRRIGEITQTPLAQDSASPFAYRDFRSIWTAAIVSNIGTVIQTVGAAWLMTVLSRSVAMIALVQTAASLPIMLLALPAGATADLFDRRHIMLCAQWFMLISTASLLVLSLTGMVTPWLVLLFTFLINCGMAFHTPAWQASVGEMVSRRALPAAVAMNAIGTNVARSIGPALGGAILTTLGVAFTFAANLISYIGLIFALQRWRPPNKNGPLASEGLCGAIGTGLREVGRLRILRVVLARAVLAGATGCGLNALLPLVARDLLGGSALTFSLLVTGFGIGAIAGALIVSPLRHRLTTEAIIRLASLALAAATLTTSLSRMLPVSLAALGVAGGGWIMVLSSCNVTVQLNAPRVLLARCLSVYLMATFGGIALGSWAWGQVAERYGIAGSLQIAAATQFLTIMVAIPLRMDNLPES